MLKFKNVIVGISACILAVSLSAGHLSASGNTLTVNASNVNLRSGPSASNKAVGLLQSGNKVTVLSQSSGWYKVNAFGVIGWVKNSFVSSSAASSSASTSTIGRVSASDVNLRSSASTSSKVAATLQQGDSLKVLDQSGDWYKVSTSNGRVGWVKKDFVSFSQSTASRNSSRIASRGETTRESSVRDEVTDYAKTLLGVRYVWGGTTPSGFDCSGFTKYVFQHFGVSLNRVAADQAQQGVQVSRADLRPGDLVFFDTDGGHNYINHSGIYIGGGMFIQESSGAGKVVISPLSEGFYANSYMTARRVLN